MTLFHITGVHFNKYNFKSMQHFHFTLPVNELCVTSLGSFLSFATFYFQWHKMNSFWEKRKKHVSKLLALHCSLWKSSGTYASYTKTNNRQKTTFRVSLVTFQTKLIIGCQYILNGDSIDALLVLFKMNTRYSPLRKSNSQNTIFSP